MTVTAGLPTEPQEALSWGDNPDLPELSVRTANMITLYFERTYGRERLLELWKRHEVPLPLAHLRDYSRFVSLRFVERLTQILLEESGDPDFVHKAGLFVAKPEATGFLFYVMKAIGTPRLGFQKMVELSPTFNRVGRFEIETLEKHRIVMTYRSDLPEQNRNLCIGRMAQFSALPTVWGVPPARVLERGCQVLGAEACRYEFEWEEPSPRWQFLTGGLLGLTLLAIGIAQGYPVRGVLAAAVAVLTGLLLEARALLSHRNEQLAAQNRGLSDSLADLQRINAELSARVDARTAELSEANQRLEHSLAQQRELDRLKQEFFDNVSHELRTPLTLILLPLHALLHGGKHDVTPAMRQELELLERNAQQLLGLINQLLDLARFDAGRVRLRAEPFGVRALVENVLKTFSGAAEANAQTLELVGEEVEPLWVDVERLESVFQNLLANALKFTPRGGRITVRILEEPNLVRIAVEDTGIGISPEDIPRIFERFSQAESSDGRRVGGTGIGLTLVREIVQLHGGSVAVESETGRGTTFTVTLRKGKDHLSETIRERRNVQVPVSADRRAARLLVGTASPSAFVPQTPVPELMEVRSSEPLSEERVLIVEDNPELRASIERILSPHFHVLSAADGEEGWRVAQEQRPSLIVSDVMMPSVSGVDLLRRIRSSPELSEVPVILLTARRSLPAVLEGFEAGASDYLSKPFAPSELLARVEAQLKLRNAAVRAAENQRLAVLGLLTSGFAHEVRNPLNGLLNVLGPLKEMLEQAKVEGAGDLVLVAEECGERLRQLTHSLLSFARGEQPAGPVDVSESLSAALRIIEWQKPSNVKIERTGTSPEALPRIEGDASALDQVWLNLFDNALRAMPGGGTLEVKTEVRSRELVVTVRDTGEGIAPTDLPRVFDPFFSTRSAGQGTGLGLAICRRIILRHGGDLRIRSTPGQGTDVEVSLPLPGEA